LFPYWLLFTLAAAGAIQFRPDPRRLVQGGPVLLAFALFIVLFIGLRFEVGGDWINYVHILEDIKSTGLGQANRQEPLFALLNWLAARAGLDVWAVNLVCAFIFTHGLFFFARRQPNPWLCIVVAVPYLITVVAMGYTRQGVAVGFILLGIADLERRSFVRFAIYLILATAFHRSAIIVAPLVALSATRNRWLTLTVVGFSAILVYFAFIQASVDRLMTNYVEAEYNSQGAAVRVAMNLPPAVLFLLLRKRFSLPSQSDKLWRNFSLAALLALIFLLFTSSSTAVDRLALYLIPLQMFVLCRLPVVLGSKQGPSVVIPLLVVLYSAIIHFVWLNYADNAWAWLPYRTIFVGDR
jgi:hypothetical protein